MTIYAASTGPKYERILSWIGAGKRVLDVGCGAGAFTARIAEDNDVIGVESIMWAADYPHSASSFPRSMQQIEDDLAMLTKEEHRKITWENVQNLYGI